MVRAALLMLTAVSLTGCSIVPPLDCLAGAQRSGCHRDANGEYHYLYTSPFLPAPQVVGVVPAAPPQQVMQAAPPPVSDAQPRQVALQPMIVPTPPVKPLGSPAALQPAVAVSPQGTAMGVVVPMGGGNDVVVSPDGQP
jgi:hypothetical protein